MVMVCSMNSAPSRLPITANCNGKIPVFYIHIISSCGHTINCSKRIVMFAVVSFSRPPLQRGPVCYISCHIGRCSCTYQQADFLMFFVTHSMHFMTDLSFWQEIKGTKGHSVFFKTHSFQISTPELISAIKVRNCTLHSEI